jgi:DNA-binding transcriptional MerR regulator
LSIGEVLNRLRVEFPDTTISKLRFLETEGLVQPRRTPSGYRKYSESDVERLRFILAAQRDQYLPLRVIRQHLDEERLDAGKPPPRPTLVAVKETGRLGREELCDRAGIAAALLADLEQHGLITQQAGGWYDADALTVAEVAGRLAEYGLEPRHLRAYKVAADREAGVFAQVVKPLQRQQARADDALRELILLSQRMHLALLRSGLSQTLGH